MTMPSLEPAHDTVRAWFALHGADEAEHRVAQPDSAVRVWAVRFDGVDLTLTAEAQQERVVVQACAAVLAVGAQTAPALMSALLRLNREALVGCAFALDEDDEVLVVADRDAERVDAAALQDLAARVREAAATFAAQLAAQFGATSLLVGDEEE